MKNTLKIILILLLLIFILILSSYKYNFKNFMSIFNDNINLNDNDISNLYDFLTSQYNNILLYKNIVFLENKDNKYFICDNLKFKSNNKDYSLKIKFIPIYDKSFITKYKFFNRYGVFEIIENNLNFNVNDIIKSDVVENIHHDVEENINNNNDLFIKKKFNNINNNDTENDTTESIINNALL